MKQLLVKLNWVLSNQFGLNIRNFLLSIYGLPFYLLDWLKFRKVYKGALTFRPCLHDRFKEGGTTKSEYFWQDLLVARWIYMSKPKKHVDIGSRVDGFVAHVATFREIEVLDIRPIDCRIPGISFHQVDFMDEKAVDGIGDCYTDSISCLHAIEHFGLGRYGDPICSQGYQRGLQNLSKLLKPNGTLYLSTPLGRQRVDFNANWVFDPLTILTFAKKCGLLITKLVIVTPSGPEEIPHDEASLKQISSKSYQLGIFIFTKD